jgi:hypothetical protein
MNYDSYLFTCLLKEFDKDYKNRPYDEQYDIGMTLYKEFEKSAYNDPSKGVYECIIKYLNARP